MNEFGLGLELIKYINTLGYEAYLVGGCVRDYLLNIPSNDIDITTSMPIDEIKTHFTTIDNGSSYYSLTILYHNISFEAYLEFNGVLYKSLMTTSMRI